jgi:WD40 repeat protein
MDLAAKGSEPLVLTGHSGGVMSNVASSDGRLLVTASLDKTARVWEAATGREIRVLTHPETVLTAVFTPDGGRVVTGSTDGEPIREVSIHDEELATRRLSMMRIMARWMRRRFWRSARNRVPGARNG